MSEPEMSQRWWFIGSSGSGKSTWSKVVAAALAIPCFELDATFHQPNWTPLESGEFRRRVREFAAEDQWVIEGNYTEVRGIVLERCTVLVAMDLARRTVMRQVVLRTLRRAISRQVLWNDNQEDWRNIFRWDPERSIIRWSWTKWPLYRERIDWLERVALDRGVDVIRVSSHRQLAQELQRRQIRLP